MGDARAGSATEAMKQLIGFTVGAEEYALDLLRVREVIRVGEIRRLPGTHGCLRGVINIRGSVVPLLDLRDRFGLKKQEYDALTRVIVVEMEGHPVGLIVDSASQVIHIPEEQIDSPHPVLGGTSQDFVSGVGRIGERLVVVIDIDKLFAAGEIDRISHGIAC